MLVGAALALALVAPAPRSVWPIELHTLVEKADIVAVGRVERVFSVVMPYPRFDAVHVRPVSIAEVEVLRAAKGAAPGEHLVFAATGTWACDISEAVSGETALLFLQKMVEPGGDYGGLRPYLEGRPVRPVLYQLEDAGRGRMPLREVDGVPLATVYTDDVILPKALATIDGPQPEYARFIRSVRLEDLWAAVEARVPPDERGATPWVPLAPVPWRRRLPVLFAWLLVTFGSIPLVVRYARVRSRPAAE